MKVGRGKPIRDSEGNIVGYSSQRFDADGRSTAGSNQQRRGGNNAQPLTDGYGSTKDQGGRGAKRQTNKNHGTNRRGGRLR